MSRIAEVAAAIDSMRRSDTLLIIAGAEAMEAAADQLDQIKAEQARVLDRLLFIANVLEHEEDVSVEWARAELEAILSEIEK